MNLWYVVCARDTAGNPAPGLTPVWMMLKKLSDNSNVTPLPAITEVANGQYKFQFDPEVSGDCTGQIDFANTGFPGFSRYVDVTLLKSDSRVDGNLDAAVSSRYDGIAPVSVKPLALTFSNV